MNIRTNVFIALLFSASFASGQAYFTSGGIRLGTDWGLTIQQRVAEKSSVELIIQSSLQREEGIATLLHEWHQPLVVKNLNFYYGAGPHIGWNQNEDEDFKNPFGATLIGGVELTIARLTLSYDFKPVINLRGGEKTLYSQTGFSVRYAFVPNKYYKDLQKKKRKRERQEKWEERKEKWQERTGSIKWPWKKDN